MAGGGEGGAGDLMRGRDFMDAVGGESWPGLSVHPCDRTVMLVASVIEFVVCF
jgi:hypothetical protein